jgi:hypothetical protein
MGCPCYLPNPLQFRSNYIHIVVRYPRENTQDNIQYIHFKENSWLIEEDRGEPGDSAHLDPLRRYCVIEFDYLLLPPNFVESRENYSSSVSSGSGVSSTSASTIATLEDLKV